MIIKYKFQRDLRRKRIRSKISGTADCPRLCVFRSNKYIYGQLIDDTKGHTLVHVAGVIVKNKKDVKKVDVSKELGKKLAGLALEKNIKTVVFDRGGYRYLGRVKAFAEGAREGGLKF
jgi:large subunit ribosomal protein L18